MNNILKKLVYSENKRFITLIIIFVGSLVLSAILYLLIGKGSMKTINFEIIGQMKYIDVFIMVIKRNILYFIIIILLTYIGQSKVINVIFGLTSVYYGLSVIYLIRTVNVGMKYFMLTFTDYFIYFPLLFYFTFISSTISKYTKKTKNIETISHKFDIIISSYIKISLIYLCIVIAYSLCYSYYILTISRLLVK